MKRVLLTALVALVLCTPAAMAANNVTVASVSVNPGQTGVVVPVFLTNDANISSLVVPLVIREITPGSFITGSFSMAWADRLPEGFPNPLTGFRVTNTYPTPDAAVLDCNSANYNGAGGFSTIGPLNFVSPDGILLSANSVFPATPLLPGADATGSIRLTFNVTAVDGFFEIDTTCTTPANHLLFVRENPVEDINPTFTKGIITIGNPQTNNPPEAICQDVTVDADANCEADVSENDVDNGSNDPDGDPLTLTLNPPGPYPLGQTQVWLVVDDGTDKDSCQATITVEDNTPPVVECEKDADTLSVGANCEVALPGYFNINISDNCSNNFNVSQNPQQGTPLGPGLYTVWTIVDDQNGNKDSCSFTVLVVDNTPPTAVCPTDITVSNDPGQCGAVVNFADGGSTDNCGIDNIAFDPVSGSFFPVGTTQVTMTVTDNSGNQSSCTFDVTVNDTENPVAICPADTTVQVGVGETDAIVNFAINGTDNCPGVVVTANPPSGSLFPLGTTTVTVKAEDAAGNEHTCTFDVTVTGGSAPPVALCADRTVSADEGCEADANIDNGSFDPDGGSLIYSYDPPGPYPLGQTLVTLLVTDDEGDTASCSATVTVLDDTAPEVTCLQGELNAYVDQFCEHELVDYTTNGGYTVSENCTENENLLITQDPAPGTILGVGSHTITIYVEDEAGNIGSCSFTLNVFDGIPPSVQCPDDFTVSNDPGQCGAVVDYSGSIQYEDNCGIATVEIDPQPGSFLPVGTTLVAVSVTDVNGNNSYCEFNVTVEDNEPPSVQCPADITVNVNAPNESAVVNWVTGFDDNCPGASVECTPPSGSTFPLGETTVTCTATDAAGNTNTCQFTVTVNQVSEPIMAVTPDSISLKIVQGGPLPDSVEICISNTGTGGAISFDIFENINWLDVNPTSGQTDDCVWASVNTTGLNPGVYYGTIYVCGFVPSGSGCQFNDSVNVVLQVNSRCDEASIVCTGEDSLVFKAGQCDAEAPDCQYFDVLADDECDLPWDAYFDAPWLSVNPTSGGTPSKVEVCVDPSGLAPGLYKDTIYIYESSGVAQRSAFVPDCMIIVCLEIEGGESILGLDSAYYKFYATVGEPAPDPQYLDIYNAAEHCPEFDWTATNNRPWLTVDPDNGTTPSTTELSVDHTGLSAGNYWDTIRVTAPGVLGSPGLVLVELCVADAPVEPEAEIWLTRECGEVGDTVEICVNFCNNFEASGISLGLHYDNPAIRIIGASFVGSRVEYLGSNATATFNDVDQTICLAAYVIPPQALIQPGCGKFASLYFLIESDEACPEEIVVKIDSMFVGGGCEALLTDANQEPVYPSFEYGSVCIRCPTECNICGVVRDSEENPINGATVQLWDDYPSGSVLHEIVTGPNGAFCFEDLDSEASYDIRVYAAGYCTDIFENLNCLQFEGDLFLTDLPVVPTQPFAADWWSVNATNEGYPILPGDVITATDPQGVVCGVAVVTEAGQYLIQVVGDDPTTPVVDEGAVEGDEIVLYLNCKCPIMAPGTWVHLGSTQFDANFDCSRRTIDIQLCDVWTLISFNVLPESPLVADVLQSIDGQYQHLLSATCVEGNISWEKDRPINDLTAMDPCHGYWLKTTAPGVGPLVIEGAPVDADKPLNLCGGWNAISYVPTQWDDIGHALGSIDGKYEHVFTAECDGFRSWDRNRPAELNDLICMKPGYGYWIKMDEAATQTYSTSGYSCSENGLAKPVNITQRVTITPRVSDFWSASDPLVTGINANDRITVKTQSGLIVGEALAGSRGMFMVHVYGDDPTTNLIDGARAGEPLTFEVNGVPARVSEGSAVWTERKSSEITVIAAGASPVPTEYSLLQNYPNPFNAGTNISFRLRDAGDVSLVIYNVLGSPVRTVHSGWMSEGEYTITWDGRLDNGSDAQSGVYFYRLQAGTWSETKKMTLLK